MSFPARWNFLRRAYLPHLLAAGLAAPLSQTFDTVSAWFAVQSAAEITVVLGLLALLHLIAWYATDVAVTGRCEGWQLIAPVNQGNVNDHFRAWLFLTKFILAAVVLPFVPLMIRPLHVDNGITFVRVWHTWSWLWSYGLMTTTNLIGLSFALAHQQAYRAFEHKVLPGLLKEFHDRREVKRQRKLRQVYRHQLDVYYKANSDVLLKALPKAIFQEAVKDAIGEHVPLEQIAKNAAELLARLETIATGEGERIEKNRQELEAVQQQHQHLLAEIDATRREYDRLLEEHANTSLVEEHLAKLRQRFRQFDEQLRDLQSRTPPRMQ